MIQREDRFLIPKELVTIRREHLLMIHRGQPAMMHSQGVLLAHMDMLQQQTICFTDLQHHPLEVELDTRHSLAG